MRIIIKFEKKEIDLFIVGQRNKMSNHHIEPTRITPLINFDTDKHHFVISGRSLPENTRQFYEPPLAWISEYLPEDGASIVLEMKFTYINSSSLIAILSIVRKLKQHLDHGCTLKVNWIYEKDDEDLLLAGEDIANLAGVAFDYIEIN